MYRVLIVEDDRTNRLFYRKLRVWQQEGFLIAGEAGNGREALELLHAEHFDVFLVDVMMPVMNGLDFLRELKKRNAGGIKIIASNYNEFDYVRQGMQLGASDYLLKPVTEEALEECLQNIRQELEASQAPALTERIFRTCGVDVSAGFVQKLMAYFSDHTDLNLSDISEAFQLSPDYFGRLFKRQMSENFNTFVLRYKMEYARCLLAETEDRVYEISNQLGYRTADYFTKLFREYTGMTPVQYRKSLEKPDRSEF